MTLVELLDAGVQLPGKYMNFAVTDYLTLMEGLIETVKTDLRAMTHLFST